VLNNIIAGLVTYIERLKMKQANARALNGIDLNVELGEALALV
jgi:hypothetical protein